MWNILLIVTNVRIFSMSMFGKSDSKNGNLVRNCWAYLCIRLVTCVNYNFQGNHSRSLARFPFYSYIYGDLKGFSNLLKHPTGSGW